MSTVHLGIEELIAHRQHAAMNLATRHTWRLTDFVRTQAHTPRHSRRPAADKLPRLAELAELARLQLRWAMA